MHMYMYMYKTILLSTYSDSASFSCLSTNSDRASIKFFSERRPRFSFFSSSCRRVDTSSCSLKVRSSDKEKPFSLSLSSFLAPTISKMCHIFAGQKFHQAQLSLNQWIKTLSTRAGGEIGKNFLLMKISGYMVFRQMVLSSVYFPRERNRSTNYASLQTEAYKIL